MSSKWQWFLKTTPESYDAEQLIHWIKNYKRINPMTNAVVPCGKINSVSVPFRLPHMGPEDLEKTAQYLDQQGYLLWRPCVPSGWQDCLGMCVCVATLTCAVCGMFTLLECSLDLIQHRDLSVTV